MVFSAFATLVGVGGRGLSSWRYIVCGGDLLGGCGFQ